ncbi:hypothetical protein L249_7202 [Ophiocordyceps polyrhachis-furcata BCC 54312]|uniref:Uncharacterized protein n=1 Tax=Ophiocordyceps polyrhachis-furcata BCC 54312 TaxID=1330021 RepID=A0A367LA50_9HYPO|nr:hypothetical protein L249_7202 [Ophiocordyceps polyrhachis-furcata BCC 54312]
MVVTGHGPFLEPTSISGDGCQGYGPDLGWAFERSKVKGGMLGAEASLRHSASPASNAKWVTRLVRLRGFSFLRGVTLGSLFKELTRLTKLHNLNKQQPTTSYLKLPPKESQGLLALKSTSAVPALARTHTHARTHPST